MTNVILIVFILALGIRPLELLALIMVSVFLLLSRTVTVPVIKMNIRIYHECEGRIEKHVPRIAVWHHEACQVMTNGDSEGQIFLSHSHE